MSLLTAIPSSSRFLAGDPCIIDAEEYPDWPKIFENDHPLKLEIGFGMGDFLIEMAAREPNSSFVGIDFAYTGIQNILSRIKKFHLKNIRIIYGDVRKKMPLLFKNEELDTVYINFPDPWPRKRHFKRRLIKPELANLIANKLTPQGRIHIATDSESYALEILEYFNAESLLQNNNRESGFLNARCHLPKTKYEKSFIYAGDQIHYLEYYRATVEKITGELQNKISSKEKTINQLKDTGKKTLSNDEPLIKIFQNAELNANDACDLKQVADHLAEAGDKQWAKKVYIKAENRAEDSLDLNWLAYSISEMLGDKEWAKQLYRKAERMTESSLDLNWLAYSISETLGDKAWTTKLFITAESKPVNARELCDLADSISEILGDVDWGYKVYKNAEDKAETHSDFHELADTISIKPGDREWAAKLYQKAEDRAEDSSDLQGLAESLCKNLADRKWAKKVYVKACNLAQDSGDFSSLADSLCDTMKDKEWAENLYKIAENKAEKSHEFRWLADSLCENQNNRAWTKEVYKKAEDRAKTFFEFRWLAESLLQKLGDNQWANQVTRRAEARAKDPSDFKRLICRY